ncbi:MAG TPA: aldo/keto reductase [Agriterribacter sp.]|nr:aldo/keto reductase [Agriterribacter sp.]
MEYTIINGYKISKLVLGTVALGMDYGISNTKGRPDSRQSAEVLSTAWKAGINTLDTARTYGMAEQIIGSYLEKKDAGREVNVISKFKLDKESLDSYDLARKEAVESVMVSLDKLKIPKLPVCLLHMSRELNEKRVLEYVPAIFKELKEMQMIDMAGVSIDHPRELAWFEDEEIISAYQVPVNIFDQRLLRDDMLDRVHKKGKLLFARSVFLQGLFFLHPDQLKGNRTAARPFLEQLHLLAKKEGLTIAELSFSYIRHMQSIASIVFGAENTNQVEQNVQLMSAAPLGKKVTDHIAELFNAVPEDIITPGNWKM